MQTQKEKEGGTFCYRVSVDGGVSFQEIGLLKKQLNRPDLPENPLVAGWHDAPRIYWSEQHKRYVLYLKQAHRVVHQYHSDDLKSWTQVNDAPAIPESFMFEGDPGEIVDMHPENDPSKTYQVVMYGLHGYIVGYYGEEGMLNLDGEPIDKDDLILTTHFGYPTIFHNPKDGRIIMSQNLGSNGVGGMPKLEIDYYTDASIPVELTLHETADGPRLRFNPVRELESLHGKAHTFDARKVDNEASRLEGLQGRTFRIQATIAAGDAKEFGFNVFGEKVVYNVEFGMLAVDINPNDKRTDRKRRSLPLKDGRIKLDILVDTTSVEVFANDGMVHIPHGRQEMYRRNEGDIQLFAEGGSAAVESLTVHELNSIWHPDAQQK